MAKKIPFDIKYRPQIENGEYRVETKIGDPARIICWDSRVEHTKPIGALVKNPNGTESLVWTNKKGEHEYPISIYDLFIIIPEPEWSEDERINKFLRHTFTAQYLCKDKTGKWHGEPVTNILAYLEKQKEQPTNEEMLRILRTEYEKGVADTITKYEQKEKKSVEHLDMNKFYKEVKDGICSIPKEVTCEEIEVQRRKYENGEKHEHIFGEDRYAASGWYGRKCIICGYFDLI